MGKKGSGNTVNGRRSRHPNEIMAAYYDELRNRVARSRSTPKEAVLGKIAGHAYSKAWPVHQLKQPLLMLEDPARGMHLPRHGLCS
jgi:hypothetical protein